MPIYEYVCAACQHRSEILHGINEAGPHFCPECGAEGTMRKGFAPPAIVFKGSGWAKKDRGAATRTKAAARDGGGEGTSSSGDSPAAGSGSSGGEGKSAGSSGDAGGDSRTSSSSDRSSDAKAGSGSGGSD